MYYQGYQITKSGHKTATGLELFAVEVWHPDTRKPVPVGERPLFLGHKAAKAFVDLEYALRQAVYSGNLKGDFDNGQDNGTAPQPRSIREPGRDSRSEQMEGASVHAPAGDAG